MLRSVPSTPRLLSGVAKSAKEMSLDLEVCVLNLYLLQITKWSEASLVGVMNCIGFKLSEMATKKNRQV
jgi:hypothetical protein